MKTKALFNALADIRPVLLEKSLADAIVWCGAPDDESRRPHRSDQYWMRVFSSPTVTAAQMKNFIGSFMLARASWDYSRAADLVNAMIAKKDFDPAIDIAQLALDMRMATKKRSQQTSAASKIMMFAKPAAGVFIWDQLASRATRLAEWHREGLKADASLDRLYTRPVASQDDPTSPHDYAAYAAACAKVLEEQLASPDFQSILARFNEYLASVDGPMGGKVTAGTDFVARRLLDKLMFHEGWYLRHWHQTKGETGSLVPSDLVYLSRCQTAPMSTSRLSVAA